MVFFVPIWKQAPFIRVFVPFAAGIIVQYYTDNASWIAWALLSINAAGIILFSFLPLQKQFLNYHAQGICINLLLFAVGALITAVKNPYRQRALIDAFTTDSSTFIAVIDEPHVEKKASWKAVSRLIAINNGHVSLFPSSKLLLYFRKDSLLPCPRYGQQIFFAKSLENIRNRDPPGRFDYVRYCALKNIHYQVFLNAGEYEVLAAKEGHVVTEFIFRIRQEVVAVIKANVAGRQEAGLALALLIGYKDDLDRELLQAYSNTGVVHVIAISGLHLGLIYALLNLACKPLQRSVAGRFISAAIVICGLWLFTLLAGAAPSVLRSAVMFTAIIAGGCLSKKTSLINNLAASAFILLCVDPYWLWDLGFILSYTALLSIALFNKPMYQLLVVKNKIIDAIWKLNAVTLAAQILTMPVIIYNFGQFPNLFLLTNFIAVPLSSVILMTEIALCCISHFQTLAHWAGIAISAMIRLMNRSIVFTDRFSFSTTRGLDINLMQVILLYVFIASISFWLLRKKKYGLYAGLVTAILFFTVRLF
jgi:competence protein ComEC